MKISVLITGSNMIPVSSNTPGTEMNSSSWYAIGAMIVVLIPCYLKVALTKPEKF